MALGDLLIKKGTLHLFGELEETELIGHRRLSFPQTLCKGFLGQFMKFEKLAVRDGFLDR